MREAFGWAAFHSSEKYVTRRPLRSRDSDQLSRCRDVTARSTPVEIPPPRSRAPWPDIPETVADRRQHVRRQTSRRIIRFPRIHQAPLLSPPITEPSC
ncbi:hypothetical protein MRX96_008751 [Rhipicephalus microplus]